MSDPIVRISALRKQFKDIVALDSIDLEIYPGKIMGLLGDNGAGKSSLLRHIIGLYLPDSGTCSTFGVTAGKLGPDELSRIGYVHQNGELLDWMTVKQHVQYVAAYYDTWNHELEEKFIHDFELPVKSRVGTLSPGQKQRLAILIAICHEPAFLILDEPAASLDPLARMQFLDLLLEMIQTEGRSIIISSHILSDVEKVIDHAIIMRKGSILRDCSFDELQESFARLRLTATQGDLPEELPLSNIIECQNSQTQAVVVVASPSEGEISSLEATLHCQVSREPLPLDDIYKYIILAQAEVSQ